MKKLLFISILVLIIGIIHDNYFNKDYKMTSIENIISLQLQERTCMNNNGKFINNECYFK